MSFYDRNTLKNGILSKLYDWATGQLATKADKATTLSGYGITNAYTKTEVDTAISGKADASTTYTKTECNNTFASKSNTYTKSEVDTALSAKANTTDTYTKTQVDNALSGKANTATTLAGYGITNAYTKSEVNTALGNKANTWTLIGTETGTSTSEQSVDTLDISSELSLAEFKNTYTEVFIQASATNQNSGIATPEWVSLSGTYILAPMLSVLATKPNARPFMAFTNDIYHGGYVSIREVSNVATFSLLEFAHKLSDSYEYENWLRKTSGLGNEYSFIFSVYAR